MNDAVRYGQMQSEKRAEENAHCRQIVREINLQGGLTQRQTLLLIYLLASELENVDQMKAITKLVRELGGEDLFVIGGPDGSSDA
jgi:hypothetical protein